MIKPHTKTDKWKWKWIRSDRDLIDILTTIGVIVALLAVFGVFEQKPKVEIAGELLYFDFKDYTITDKLINYFKPSTKQFEDRWTSTKSTKNQISWLVHPWLFEITIKNQRSQPISLENFSVQNFDYAPPLEYLKFISKPLFILDEQLNEYQTPYYNIGGNETKKINLIVCVTMVIEHRTGTAKKLHKQSVYFLNNYIKLCSTDTSLYIDSLYEAYPDMFKFTSDSSERNIDLTDQTLKIGGGKEFEDADNFINNPDACPFVFRLVYEEYFNKCKFHKLQFSVKDNFGNTHLSEPINLKVNEQGKSYFIPR